jgi:hypothetical protein
MKIKVIKKQMEIQAAQNKKDGLKTWQSIW